MVFHELNTVVVFTDSIYTSKETKSSILEKYIMPAID